MRIHFLMFIFFLFQAFTVTAVVTSQDISQSIRKDLRHPYMYFSESEKPAIRDRIASDPECRDIMARLLAESNRLLYTPVEKTIPPENKDSRFDTPSPFLTIFNNYISSAYNLAFVYQMTGEEKYARKSFEFADVICDLPTWVMRACQFPKAYPRVSPWNVPDDKVVFTYDIIASSTATSIAAVYDWLYPALTKAQRDRIRSGLLEKAVVQVRGNWDYHWWATAYRCNWCAWCCEGLGLASCTLLTEDPRLTDVIAECYNRMTSTLDEAARDGGWEEGGGYWAQTIKSTVQFAAVLKRLTGGAHDLFKHPALAKDPVKYPLYLSVPPGKSVNFADAGGYQLGSTRLYNKIAQETGSMEAAWIRANQFGAGGDIFDILWPRPSVKPGLPAETSIHFPFIDWAIMRSDFTDPGKVMVACKAGRNGDPHHGHLDVGQFMVYWRGLGYICDLGSAVYDEKYFDAEKYDTPQASSIGHNLIFVNGECQITGKRKDQPRDDSIGGKILEFRPGNGRDYTLLDATNAYPKKELKKWRRHIILEKPVITVVVDEVGSAKGTEIEARFHSEAEQRMREGFTLLHGKDGDMALIPVIEEKFTFRPDSHPYLAFQKQASFQRIQYNGTVIHAASEYTILAHIILPVKDESEAQAVVKSARRSGDFIISYEYRGKKYEYRFRKEGEGLVLEK